MFSVLVIWIFIFLYPNGADVINTSDGITATGADAGALYSAIVAAMDGGTSSFEVQGKLYNQFVDILPGGGGGFGGGSGSGGGGQGIIPPGQITFVGLTPAQLKDFIIINPLGVIKLFDF